MWFYSGLMHYSWSANHALDTKHNGLIKATQRDETEMKHIPLGFDLLLQMRQGKFICADVKPYSPFCPIATRSKVSRLSSSQERAGHPRHTADSRNQGGNWRSGRIALLIREK